MKELEKRFERAGLRVSSAGTLGQERSAAESQFDIIVVFLMVMAILLAVGGALGLMGTMSINVLERMREIGVMRAIGASDGAVLRVFMAEGLLIGLLSWLLGTLLAFPLSKLLSDAVGTAFWRSPLSYSFSPGGALLWLLLVVLLAALATSLPALRASRVSVREVLAYE
jgi:putative ABC transport system permease protein